jgi:hypothetical protein
MSPNRVVGDHHVEAARVADQVQAGGVGVGVVEGDPGLGGHRPGRPLPEVAGVHEHVGLVDQGQPPGPLAGLGGGEPQAALDPGPGLDRGLGGGLGRAAPVDGPAGADVHALGVLATSRSMSSGATSASGDDTPGYSLTGRKFT